MITHTRTLQADLIRCSSPTGLVATPRVLSDHLGSPRLVVNVADSAERPFRADYSAFGKVTGTGLDWMPFGFAGGIYDPDTKLVRFVNPFRDFLEAEESAERHFKKPGGGHNGPGDAYRHCLASCSIKQEFGSGYAEFLGDLRELINPYPDKPGEKEMDEENKRLRQIIFRRRRLCAPLSVGGS